MKLTAVLIVYCALGQVGGSGDRNSSPRTVPRRQAAPLEEESIDSTLPNTRTQRGAAQRSGTGLTTVDQIQPKLRAPEILAEALSDVTEGGLSGTGITLQQALSRSNDRPQQIKIVQAYWRLSCAQGDYHFAREQRIRFQQITKGQLWLDPETQQQPNAAIYAARNVNRAIVRDSEDTVLRAQHALAELMGTDPTKPLPLAIDRPHVGPFRTELKAVYQNRTPPAKHVLIDGMLPIRYNAIDAHTRAILTANDAVEATAEEYRAGQTDLTTLLATLDELWRQRHAFLVTVRDYNQDFAEYSLGTAAPGTSSASLVARLIKTRNPNASRGRTFSSEDEEGSANGSSTNQRPQRSILRGDPSGEDGARLFTPSARFQQVSFLQNNRRPLTADNLIRGMYRDLIGTDKFKRGARVGATLHERRSTLSAGQSISLAKCLEGVSPDRRQKVIDAYWDASARLARHQLFEEEIEVLHSLLAPTAQLRQIPGGNGAMLRLQASKFAALADVQAELADLFEAQFDLTVFAGRAVGGKLLAPSTPPHAGRYDLRLDAQQSTATKSRAVQRAASLIPVLHAELCDRSGAIVHFDAARVDAISGQQVDTGRINAALDAIHRQTNEALSYLDAQTRYNESIAEYALNVMPRDTSANSLVSALIVTEESRVGPSG